MSLLAKLFGNGKPSEAVLSPSEAIQRLLEVEERLIKKQEYLEKKAEVELQTAKKHGTKNKRVALKALRNKKKYEKQLAQIDNTLTTIEYQREALENAGTNKEVLKVMKLAGGVLEKVHGEIDIDKVHDVMDNIQEQQDVAREISDAFAAPLYDRDIDVDELDKELEELMEDDVIEDLIEVPDTKSLPDLPVPKQTKKKAQEDEDFKELAAWAS